MFSLDLGNDYDARTYQEFKETPSFGSGDLTGIFHNHYKFIILFFQQNKKANHMIILNIISKFVGVELSS